MDIQADTRTLTDHWGLPTPVALPPGPIPERQPTIVRGEAPAPIPSSVGGVPGSPYAFLDGPTPVAMAHRGGAIEHLENTMPAFEECVKLGYRYLETDVRVTSDGQLVVFHDPTLDRVTDRTGRVDALPWREVQTALIGGREPIMRLEDLLGAWPDVRFNLDIKAAGVLAPLVHAVRR